MAYDIIYYQFAKLALAAYALHIVGQVALAYIRTRFAAPVKP